MALPSMHAIWDCVCKLKKAVENQTDKDEQILSVEGCDLTISNGNTVPLPLNSYPVYKLSDGTPGVINREWHDTAPTIPIADSTTAAGRAFRLAHDFSLPTTTSSVNTNLNLNDTDNTAGELDVQVLDTVITVPAGGIWIRYTGGSEGYWAIEVGFCCGQLQLIDELGYQDRTSNIAEVGPVFLPEGQHNFRAWNIDSGGTSSAHTVSYSTDGTTFANTLPAGATLTTDKREVECLEVDGCDEIPEGYEICAPKPCTSGPVDPAPTAPAQTSTFDTTEVAGVTTEVVHNGVSYPLNHPAIPVIPAPQTLTKTECVGPFMDQTNRTGWLQTWIAPVTTNTGTITGDWIPLSPAETSPSCATDVHVSVDFGVLYYQLRRMRMYQWADWRLLVNGAAVLTETYDEYNYASQREDTNPDVIRPLDVRSHTMGHSNAIRLNVPASATLQVEVRYRYNFNGAQTSAYGRLIQGLRSQATFVYHTRNELTDVTIS